MDKAGKTYWGTYWKKERADSRSFNTKYYVHRRFIEIFDRFLKKRRSLLEVGCANSKWLPFFKKRYALSISGLDYSSAGIAKSRQILKANKLQGHLYLRDLFSANHDLQNKFDALVSLGVIEHFTDYPIALAKMSGFLKKKGIIITIIPNLQSWAMSFLQKFFSRKIFHTHILITPQELAKAHEKNKFKTLTCNYFGSFGLNVINLSDQNLIARYIWARIFSKFSALVWFFLDLLHWKPETKIFSPYLLYIGIKQ